jgi:hypothetical protein
MMIKKYENVCYDKVRDVAIGVAKSEREKNPEVPVMISPIAWNGETAVRFRVDRILAATGQVPATPNELSFYL